MTFKKLRDSNTFKGEWNDPMTAPMSLRRLLRLRLWDRTDYLLEAAKKLNDTSIYKKVEFQTKTFD